MRAIPRLSTLGSIAHVSDTHVMAPSTKISRRTLELATRFASFGRSLDPRPRVDKLTAALDAARDAGAVHLVISGDLTETGMPEQFEALAETLFDARIDPDRVTLVPGNHDAYTRPDAWARAIEGPLARFRRASAPLECASGNVVVVERANAFLLPLDVACHQHYTRAAGELTADAAHALEQRVHDVSGRGKPVVIVLHHSPLAHTVRAWNWLHGLRGGSRILDLLARYPDVHVLHGHLHHDVELSLDSRRPRLFGAPAVVDDAERAPRVRFYEVAGSELRSCGAAAAEAAAAQAEPASRTTMKAAPDASRAA